MGSYSALKFIFYALLRASILRDLFSSCHHLRPSLLCAASSCGIKVPPSYCLFGWTSLQRLEKDSVINRHLGRIWCFSFAHRIWS